MVPGRDHPRSRGVYFELLGPARFDRGSSPLARGLREPALVLVDPTGIIPARAGFTADPREIRSRERDHPRSRGVYGSVGSVTSSAVGSSPLARGLRQLGGLDVDGPRIIPARAGFTEDIVAVLPFSQDHPRSRGVYGDSSTDDGVGAGSSPLARGLHFGEDALILARRIIPARAGFTNRTADYIRRAKDHPRSRGVYERPARPGAAVLRIIPARAGFTSPRRGVNGHRRDHPCSRGVYIKGDVPTNYFYGSSPLARGLLVSDPLGAVETRIIPARAGFTTCGCGGGCGGGDHPRSRGVYAQGAEHVVPVIGSSPLARGLRLLASPARTLGGIIPARAGFTASRPPYPPRGPDHPRSRGVYPSAVRAWRTVAGSSPLARGLLHREDKHDANLRIIPARAGFTP